MEANLHAVLDFLRSKGAKSGDVFPISFFFQMTDSGEIDGPGVIAALDLAVRRRLLKPCKALVRTYQVTDAGFDMMHELPLSFGLVPLSSAVQTHART